MKSAGLHPHAIKGLVDGHVKRMRIVANAELDVARDALPGIKQTSLSSGARSHKGQLAAGGIHHHEARASQAAAGKIDVALRIDGDAVATILTAEIDQRS